jgi:hypothetical protein
MRTAPLAVALGIIFGGWKIRTHFSIVKDREDKQPQGEVCHADPRCAVEITDSAEQYCGD